MSLQQLSHHRGLLNRRTVCTSCGSRLSTGAPLQSGKAASTHSATTPLSSTASWFHVKCPCCGGAATRDPDTLDTFVDSSWYFARYLAPHNSGEIVPRAVAQKWLPVDFYVGGIEHAILHLLYARFFHKFMQQEVCGGRERLLFCLMYRDV